MQDHHQTQSARDHGPITLMLIGGGIRFPAFIGALRSIEEMGLKIGKIVGASTGGVVAALYAAGVSPAQMQQLSLELDATQFRDFSPGSLFANKGLYKGDALEQWFDGKLAGKRFRDFSRTPLSIITTDIRNRAPFLLSTENVPDMKVSTALRFSVGVPFVFACRDFMHRGRKMSLVDGSIMAGVIETKSIERERTLVIRTFSKRTLNRPATSRLAVKKYAAEILNVLFHALDREFLKGGRWRDTITIHCGDVPPLAFSIPPEQKQFLHDQGYQQTSKYLRYKWGI